MSRLSRANVKARESIFASGPELYRGDIQATCPPALYDCVTALEDCTEEVGLSLKPSTLSFRQASEAQLLFRNGTQDLVRMTRILESQRVFTLVGESTVKQYKASLIDEVEPAINELISLADAGLKELLKKETQLKARVEAYQSRRAGARPEEGKTMAAQKLEQRRLNGLVKQKERLENEIKELEELLQELVSFLFSML
jgi:DASH complex subunit SPC19